MALIQAKPKANVETDLASARRELAGRLQAKEATEHAVKVKPFSRVAENAAPALRGARYQSSGLS